MNSRYVNTQSKVDKYGKTINRPSLYPPIPKLPDDTYVLTVPGDRLDLLAYKYYGNVNYAWIIAEANGVGKGNYVLSAALQLRIPSNITEIIREYELLNTL